MEDIIAVKIPGLDSLPKQEQLYKLKEQFEISIGMAKGAYILAIYWAFEMNKRKLYKPEYTNFRYFVKAELGYGKSKVYADIRTLTPYYELVAEDTEVDFGRLRQGYALAVAGGETVAKKIFTSARVHNDEHFSDTLRELQGLLIHDLCLHNKEDEVTRTYIYCGKCNKNLGMVEG